MAKYTKVKIGNNIIDCKIVETYDDTVRIEYPTYDYRGFYSGYMAETVSKDGIIL